MYYLSEGHALNLLDVIHPKRGDLMVNERTVSQKHQNYIISRWICRVNNILFSDAFWISKANELVSHFFSIFWMFHVKIRQKRNKKRRISLNHAGTLWILSILTGFRVRARYHFISVYMFAIALNMVRCFARFLCFPVFVFCQSIAISKLIKHISVANEIFLSSYVDLYSVHS